MDLRIIVSNFLRKRRDESGLIQAEMAQEMGVSDSAYCRLEQGKSRLLTKSFERAIRYWNTSLIEVLSEGKIQKTENGFLMASDYETEKIQTLKEEHLREIDKLQKEIDELKKSLASRDETIKTILANISSSSEPQK